MKLEFTTKDIILSASAFVLFLIGIITFYANWMQVRPSEYLVVRQFGEIVRIVDEPGPVWKVPFLQSVERLEKQQLIYDVAQAEINTRDKKRMLIDNYAIWEITEPKKMIRNIRSKENAESRMGELIYSVVRQEFGQLNYDQIISDEKSGRGALSEIVTKKVNEQLEKDHYGIKVIDVNVKRTDLPTENEKSVYTRMISERGSKAQEYLSMGDAEKNRVMAETDREVTELLAKAKADAEKIRGEGEGKAAKIYNDTFSQDPEFYKLYRTLESYKKTINEDTVIILPSDSPYARILTGYTQ